MQRSIDVAAHAGTAFDGKHLFQIAEDRIQKIDPKTGRVLATIPAPGGGGDSGLAWAEDTLWVGQHRGRKIHQIDPETGAILRTIESNRVVTGVTWIDGELWHGTWEGEESDVRRVDPRTGQGLERLEMPRGAGVSGLESDGGDRFFCGGGSSGKVRAVRRPRRGSAAKPKKDERTEGALTNVRSLQRRRRQQMERPAATSALRQLCLRHRTSAPCSGTSYSCHEQTLHLAESRQFCARFNCFDERPWLLVAAKERDQGMSVRATRKPSVSNRTLTLRLKRTAARTCSLSLRQEPPRTTRKLGSPPWSQADPSVGATS